MKKTKILLIINGLKILIFNNHFGSLVPVKPALYHLKKEISKIEILKIERTFLKLLLLKKKISALKDEK